MAKRSRQRKSRKRPQASPVFQRRNYILLILGLLAVAVGYVMMRVDNQVESIVSLYVAPLLILGGYLEIIYAILWRPKDEVPSSEAAVSDQS